MLLLLDWRTRTGLFAKYEFVIFLGAVINLVAEGLVLLCNVKGFAYIVFFMFF